MNSWTVDVTGGRGDAVGVAVENTPTELVELLVDADIPGRQMKVAEVVAVVSVVVVVGVGAYNMGIWIR